MILLALALTTALAGPLGRAEVPVGMRVESTHHTRVDLELTATAGTRSQPVRLRRRHDQSTTTWRTADGRIVVGWSENTWSDQGPDGARSRTLPVQGHTYTLVPSDSGARVVEEVPADQAAIARQGGDLFVLLRTLRDMLPDEARPGDTVPAGPMFAGLVRDAPGEVSVDGTLELRGVQDLDGTPCQAWALDVRLSSEGPLEGQVQARMGAHLTGLVLVEEATGWTRSLEVSGPVRLDGEGQRAGTAFTLTGGGPFTSRTTLSFHRPAPAE